MFDGNFDQIPEVVEFFVRHSGCVRMASFQLLAETGRGALGRRGPRITAASVRRQIETGAGTSLSFDTIQIGHSRCNRCAITLVANGKVYDILTDKKLVEDIIERTTHLPFDRRHPTRVLLTLAKGVLGSPRLTARSAIWLLGMIWRAKADLLASRGRVEKLSFFIHDFMDACRLERDRIEACVFAVATNGPISMCLYNAKRDSFILDPIRLDGSDGDRIWEPLLSGEIAREPVALADRVVQGRKTAKGRLRRALRASEGGKLDSKSAGHLSR